VSVGRPNPIARGLLLTFLIALFAVVLTPSDNHAAMGVIARISLWLSGFGLSYHEVFLSLEFLANIVLFLPLGFLLPFAFRFPRQSRYLVIILPTFFGLGISLLIEMTQLWIPGRVSDPRDLVANAMGAFLGAWVAAAIRVHLESRGNSKQQFVGVS